MPAQTAPWTLERLPPVPAAFLFAARTFVAAMLALAIAFACGLERPAWAMATVYIVSQPVSGAALAKGIYRILGTLIGATFTLFTVPLLVTAPPFLTLVLSIWIAGCLYLSLRDRSPRSYVYMLAGYSAAIIGFPNVAVPQGLFGIVISRVEEIGLGIICSTALSALVLPQTAHAAGLARLVNWLRGADRQAEGMFRGTLAAGDGLKGEIGLASGIGGLHALMLYLSFEPALPPRLARAIRDIYDRTLLGLRLLGEIRDRLQSLRAEGGLDGEMQDILTRLAGWVGLGVRSSVATGDACAQALADYRARIPLDGSWTSAQLLNLTSRLRQFIDMREDCRTLWLSLEGQSAPPRAALRLGEAPAMSPLGSIDAGNAMRAAIAILVALWLMATFWILTAWPDGATAMMMVAISGSITASQRHPVPAFSEFIIASLVAIAFVFVYQFAILPLVTDFAQLCFALFPALLAAGVLIALPGWGPMGAGIAVTFTTLLGLQNTYSATLPAYANGNLAAIIGMCVAAVIVSLARSRSAEQAAGRLLRHEWEDVAALTHAAGTDRRGRIARRILERASLLPAEDDSRHDARQVIAAMFAAEGVRGLADLRPALGAQADAAAATLMTRAQIYFDALSARRTADKAPLVDAIAAFDAALLDEEDATRRAGLTALVSLLRGVEQEADPAISAEDA